jgi:Flp pilus assembly protein TadG
MKNQLPSSRRLPLRNQHAQRGSSLVFVAIVVVLAFGFVGFAVDYTHERSVANQLQDAADAAALAAAGTLSQELQLVSGPSTFPFTRQKAIDVAALNTAAEGAVKLKPNTENYPSGEIVVGVWNQTTKTFVPTNVFPNAVKVVASRTGDSLGGPLPLLFGGAWDAAASDVARAGIAMFKANSNPLIHVLDPSDKGAFSMGGIPVVNVIGGSVQVNSDDSCAMHFNGTPLLTASGVDVVGNACVPAGSVMGPVNTGADLLPDPLEDILPTVAAWNSLKNGMAKPAGGAGQISGSGVFNPGYYPKGLDIENSVSVTLKPGTYVFGGKVSLNGQAQLSGDGVTLLLDLDASLTIRGGAGVSVTPPESGALEGLVMMFHRSTDDANACSIGGSGALTFKGTVYVPAGGVDLNGTGAVPQIGQIVCNKLSVQGTATLTGEDIVPSKTGGPVYLVE